MKMLPCLSRFRLALTHHKTHGRRITEEGKISGHSPVIGSQSFPTINSVSYPCRIGKKRNPPGILFYTFIWARYPSANGATIPPPVLARENQKMDLQWPLGGERNLLSLNPSTVCSRSKPSVFNLTFSLPSQLRMSGGAMNSMWLEAKKKKKSFSMICRFHLWSVAFLGSVAIPEISDLKFVDGAGVSSILCTGNVGPK